MSDVIIKKQLIKDALWANEKGDTEKVYAVLRAMAGTAQPAEPISVSHWGLYNNVQET